MNRKLFILIPVIVLITTISVYASTIYFEIPEQNKTFTLQVKKYQSVDSATLNITGFEYNQSIFQDVYVEQANTSANHANERHFYIGRFNTRRYGYLKINTTELEESSEYLLRLYKYDGGKNGGQNLGISTAYVNDSTQTWTENNITWANQPCGSGATINGSCKLMTDPNSSYYFTTDSPEWITLNITECVENNISGVCNLVIFNSSIIVLLDDTARFNTTESYIYYPNNSYIDFSQDGDWEHIQTGFLTGTNITVDFADEINDFRSTCTPTGGYCTMTNNIYSSTLGTVLTSNFTVEYNDTLLDDCSEFTNPFITFNLYNETNKEAVNGTVEATITLYYQGQTVTNQSFKFENDDNYTICIDNTLEYVVDMDSVYYDTGNYELRTWFLDNATISTANQQNINMYMVTDTESDSIRIYIQDIDGDEVTDALVQVLRYYMDTGEYTTVTIEKTDDNGEILTYLISNDVFYKFIVVKDGSVLGTINPLKIKDTSLTFTLSESALMELFQYWDKVAYSCTDDPTSARLSCTVTDTSGLMHQVCLRVEKIGAVTNEVICNSCSDYTSSMTVYCDNVNSSVNRYSYTLYSTFNDTWILESDILDNIAETLVYGNDGIIGGAIVMGTVATIGVWNPAVAVILALTALGVAVYFKLLVIGISALISLVVVGLIVIFMVRT